MFGELVPVSGGDPIPLLKKQLLVGRRESCDICLRFSNVSAHHCTLTINGGYWFVKDMNSRNGTKINDARVEENRLDPGDVLAVAKHKYEIKYSPADLGAVGPPPSQDDSESIFAKGLLERAGLEKEVQHIKDESEIRRYNPNDDRPGQVEIPPKKS